MHRRMRHSIVVAGLVATGLLAPAGEASAGVDERQQQQRERIREGARDGSLTARETRRLATQQVRLERTERRMRRDDGVLGPREQARLDERLDRGAARIHRERRDGQAR